jgi:pimeloyl-ACP methyl ester carboxylesterase
VDGPLADIVREMAARVGPDAYLRQQTAIMGRIDSRPHLGQIKVPTLVGVGALDTLTPPALAEEMAGMIPGAVLVEFAGSGHLSSLEAPHAVREALQGLLERV